MDQTIRVDKSNRPTTKDDLEKLSKEDLISRIQSLEAHNVQLQNILKKSNSPARLKKQVSKFDFSKCKFRHVLLHMMYLGWDYQGFAVQEDTSNTVEFHLFEAFIKTCLIKDRSSSNYHRCGRTDKGVSSFGQVISIDLRSKLTTDDEKELDKEIDYCKILNRVLPDNIRCIAWAPAENTFSARFNCASRTYKYYFPKGNLNIEKMKEACTYLIGSNDLRNFAKMDVGNGVVHFIRNILDFKIEPWEFNKDDNNEYSMYVAIIKGNAFLWHQIRYIMGILFLIGTRKEEPLIIKELLDVDQNPRKPEYSMANEVPLNLFVCEYNDVQWQKSEENLKCVIEKLQETWMSTTIKGVMVRDNINSLSIQLKEPEKVKCLSDNLIGGIKSKTYVPVLKRQKCDSLEDKINHFVKRKRIKRTN